MFNTNENYILLLIFMSRLKSWIMELKEYILKNECLEIHVCNLGGTIKNIFVRDCRWKLVDVVLGFDTLEQYIDPGVPEELPLFRGAHRTLW